MSRASRLEMRLREKIGTWYREGYNTRLEYVEVRAFGFDLAKIVLDAAAEVALDPRVDETRSAIAVRIRDLTPQKDERMSKVCEECGEHCWSGPNGPCDMDVRGRSSESDRKRSAAAAAARKTSKMRKARWSSVAVEGGLPSVYMTVPLADDPTEREGIRLEFESWTHLEKLVDTLQGVLNQRALQVDQDAKEE